MKLFIGGVFLLVGVFFAVRKIASLFKGKDLDIDFGNMKFTGNSDCTSKECSI